MKNGQIICLLLFIVQALAFEVYAKRHYKIHEVTFEYNDEKVSGVLCLPKNHAEKASVLLVFVHGDGALPADAYGYYKPIWNQLAQNNIASFSWDKKGVGNSEGNWLDQSMHNRAEEVIKAIQHIQSRDDFHFSKIGLIGFSQAGWVLPEVARISEFPDFMIIVSGAINWKRQGDYMTTMRLKKEGKSQELIDMALKENQKINHLLCDSYTYQDYLEYKNERCSIKQTSCVPMNEARYNFVKLNMNADAVAALKSVKCPAFGIFGDHDLNVDVQESAQVYQCIWSKHNPTKHQIIIFPNASHSLLKKRFFNTAQPGLFFLAKFHVWGKNAFVEGFLDQLIEFVQQR